MKPLQTNNVFTEARDVDDEVEVQGAGGSVGNRAHAQHRVSRTWS